MDQRTDRLLRKVPAIFAACVALATLIPTALESAGTTIIDGQGFEAPFFDPTFGPGGPGTGAGQLQGQTPATFNGTWQRTKSVGLGDAEVQTAIKDSGNQAVKVTRAPNSDDRWAVPVDGYPTQRYVWIEWSMRVEQTVGPPNSFGPFFGVEAYDGDGTLGLLGMLGVDASNGEVLFIPQDTGVLTAPGPVVTYGAWNDFQIELDFMLHQYRFFMNGTPLGQTGFVDQNDVPGGLNEFTDADISALAAAGNAVSLALGGTAYFDNFLVSDNAIPIPSLTDADFNGDLIVDGSDFLIWQQGLGINAGATNMQGDADLDFDVDAADLAIWKQAFGGTPAVAAGGAVPEPSGIVVASLVVVSLLPYRRRSHQH